MTEPIRHPATGEPIELQPGETLHRIDWPGAPVLVVVAERDGQQRYRLARPGCRTWNPIGPLKLAPWPPVTDTSH